MGTDKCWDGDVGNYEAFENLKELYEKELESVHAGANPTPVEGQPPVTDGTIWNESALGEPYDEDPCWDNLLGCKGESDNITVDVTRDAIGNAARSAARAQFIAEQPACKADPPSAWCATETTKEENKIKAFKEDYPSLAQGCSGLAEQAQLDYDKLLLAIQEENDPDSLKDVDAGAGSQEDLDQALEAAQEKCETQTEFINRQSYGEQLKEQKIAAACAAVAAAEQNLKDLAAKKLATVQVTTSRGDDGIVFKEQCFLLAHIFQLSKFKQQFDETPSSQIKALPYEGDSPNACLLAQGDPFAFINKLTQHVGADGGSTKESFFNMETYQLSSLQPMIRLFKIVPQSDGDEKQIEIKFDSFFTSEEAMSHGATNPSHYDLEDFMQPNHRRGHGVGIKQFNFAYEADNPFAIKKSIRAKLVLFANTFDELLRDRGGYKYADLALKTGNLPDGPGGCVAVTRDNTPKNEDVSVETDTKLNFRLKAVVGWARPNGDELIGVDSSLRTAIDDSCITLNLTPTIHEFNIDEQGRVEFTLNYLAYVEDFFDQPMFNIFSDPAVTVKQIQRKLKYQTYNKTCESEKISKLRESEKDEMKEEVNSSMQSLVRNLLATRKIQWLDIPLAELAAFQAEGPLSSELDLNKYINASGTHQTFGTENTKQKDRMSITDMTRDDPEKASEALTAVRSLQAIGFFYISDLIDVILKNIEETLVAIGGASSAPPTGKSPATGNPEITVSDVVTAEQIEEEKSNYVRYLANFKKFRLLLGPMEIVHVNPEGGAIESRFVCMGDVPISVKYFIEWLTKKLLKKEQAIYPLPTFLNDFFNGFLRTFLNNDQCFSNAAKQSTKLAQTVLTAYRETADGPDEITATIKKQTSMLSIDPWEEDPPTSSTDPADHYEEDYPTSSTSEDDWEEDPPTSPQPWTLSPARRLRVDSSDVIYPILSLSGQRDNAINDPGFEKEIHYLVYFASRTYPSEKMNGILTDDHAQGIWHYQIGKPAGIVKNISLTKTDAPGLKEVRFEQEGYDGLQQLREMYDAKISTYSDVSAFPGNYIYIDPAGFSPSVGSEYDLTQLGIGGYHMIIRSEHTFGAGIANSEITAKWVAEIYKESCTVPKLGEEEPADSDESNQYKKCKLPRIQAKEEATK